MHLQKILISSFFLFCACIANAHQPSTRAYDVTHYAAHITPDIATKTLSGSVRLHYVLRQPDTSFTPPLRLDAGALQIDSVSENGQALAFEKSASQLIIQLPVPAKRKASAEGRLTITYHGAPTEGMQFLPQVSQVFTAFSTSLWLPCLDAPDNRASFDLSLILPADWQVVANGRLLAAQILPDGKQLSRWSQTRAMPSYLYGFAAGHFREVRQQHGSTLLRYLAPQSFSEEQLRQIFRDTASMLDFYADKAGVPYPDEYYTQVLASASVAQEMDGFAVMGERYGQRVLADASKIWLAAHELSHQWWGNNVTNRGWTEFWLNEGIASFMNAAYLEQRFGHEAYLKQIAATREQYEKVRAAGKDKALVFPDWDHPTAEDRSLAYDKGAYVVHLLRAEMGEQTFWRGLRAYTRQHWGKSVGSADFQTAMENASGRDLSAFFNTWVYLGAASK